MNKNYEYRISKNHNKNKIIYLVKYSILFQDYSFSLSDTFKMSYFKKNTAILRFSLKRSYVCMISGNFKLVQRIAG